MLQVLDNGELVKVGWPWFGVDGNLGLESWRLVRVLHLRPRGKGRVQYLEHLVARQDVSSLVGQGLHVQWVKPGQYWELL